MNVNIWLTVPVLLRKVILLIIIYVKAWEYGCLFIMFVVDGVRMITRTAERIKMFGTEIDYYSLE